MRELLDSAGMERVTGLDKGWEAYSRRTRGLIPREGGIAGVWFASLVYGLLYSVSKGIDSFNLIVAVIGSVLVLVLSGVAWRETSLKRLLLMVPPGLVFIYLSLSAGTLGTVFLAVASMLAIITLRLRELDVIVIGGTLVAAHGGLYIVASDAPSIVYALLPIAYTFMTVSHAGYRVTNKSRKAVVYFVLSNIILVLFLAYSFFTGYRNLALLLVADLIIRLSLFATGVFPRMSPRAYGFHEAFHSLIFLALAVFT